MIANLPLLFTNGHFIQLDDMKEDQMEKFITFLVQCSKENIPANSDINEPPWWLPDLPFVHPVKRPKKVTRKWRSKLKSLIKLCYKYYNFELLLDLSAELAQQQSRNQIEFAPKCDHLTTVLNRRHRTVIATIRNENMTYDLECPKICPIGNCSVKSEIFEIDPVPEDEKTNFLNYFKLGSKDTMSSVVVPTGQTSGIGRINFLNASYIPFSSQLGRRLATKVKYFVQNNTHMKRQERVNRYLNTSTSPLSEISTNQIVTRDKYLNHAWAHTYKFPGKTYQSHRNNSARAYTVHCRPCTVCITPMDVSVKKEVIKEEDIKIEVDLQEEVRTKINLKPMKYKKVNTKKRKINLENERFRDIRLKGFHTFTRSTLKIRLSPRLNARQTRKH